MSCRSGPPGLGIAEQVGWPEFQLLPSYQGIVIASLDDAITVDSLSQGVVITTKPHGELAPIAEAPQEGEQVASQEQEAGRERRTGRREAGEPPKEGAADPGQRARPVRSADLAARRRSDLHVRSAPARTGRDRRERGGQGGGAHGAGRILFRPRPDRRGRECAVADRPRGPRRARPARAGAADRRRPGARWPAGQGARQPRPTSRCRASRRPTCSRACWRRAKRNGTRRRKYSDRRAARTSPTIRSRSARTSIWPPAPRSTTPAIRSPRSASPTRCARTSRSRDARDRLTYLDGQIKLQDRRTRPGAGAVVEPRGFHARRHQGALAVRSGRRAAEGRRAEAGRGDRAAGGAALRQSRRRFRVQAAAQAGHALSRREPAAQGAGGAALGGRQLPQSAGSQGDRRADVGRRSASSIWTTARTACRR